MLIQITFRIDVANILVVALNLDVLVVLQILDT